MAVYRPLNEQVFDAFDRQQAGGVAASAIEASLVAGFKRPSEAVGLLAELQGVVGAGIEVAVEMLTGDRARAVEPHLSAAITTALLVRGQRYVTPSAYVAALAEQVPIRGGKITEAIAITSVRREGDPGRGIQ